MLYNNEKKLTKLFKLTIFWLAIISFFLLFAIIIKYEIKPKQKEVSIKVEASKINVCVEEDE